MQKNAAEATQRFRRGSVSGRKKAVISNGYALVTAMSMPRELSVHLQPFFEAAAKRAECAATAGHMRTMI
jgi:hypothetical protein